MSAISSVSITGSSTSSLLISVSITGSSTNSLLTSASITGSSTNSLLTSVSITGSSVIRVVLLLIDKFSIIIGSLSLFEEVSVKSFFVENKVLNFKGNNSFNTSVFKKASSSGSI